MGGSTIGEIVFLAKIYIIMTEENQSKRFGKWFTFLAWIIVLYFLTLFFNDQLDKRYNPNENVIFSSSDVGVKEVVLARNRFGHYVASGKINDKPVDFMIDTGASNVAIPMHLAQQLGLQPINPIIYQTANGNVQGYTTLIESIQLGNIILRNVRGGINPGMESDTVLLGMSFFKDIDFAQKGNNLTIRQYSQE